MAKKTMKISGTVTVEDDTPDVKEPLDRRSIAYSNGYDLGWNLAQSYGEYPGVDDSGYINPAYDIFYKHGHKDGWKDGREQYEKDKRNEDFIISCIYVTIALVFLIFLGSTLGVS